MPGLTLQWTSMPSGGGGGGSRILLVALCNRNRDKLLPDTSFDSYADV